MKNIEKQLSDEFNLSQEHVSNVLALLNSGNSVSFIANYRKEQHGSMDAQTIRTLDERRKALMKLNARKKQVEQAIQKRDV